MERPDSARSYGYPSHPPHRPFSGGPRGDPHEPPRGSRWVPHDPMRDPRDYLRDLRGPRDTLHSLRDPRDGPRDMRDPRGDLRGPPPPLRGLPGPPDDFRGPPGDMMGPPRDLRDLRDPRDDPRGLLHPRDDPRDLRDIRDGPRDLRDPRPDPRDLRDLRDAPRDLHDPREGPRGMLPQHSPMHPDRGPVGDGRGRGRGRARTGGRSGRSGGPSSAQPARCALTWHVEDALMQIMADSGYMGFALRCLAQVCNCVLDWLVCATKGSSTCLLLVVCANGLYAEPRHTAVSIWACSACMKPALALPSTIRHSTSIPGATASTLCQPGSAFICTQQPSPAARAAAKLPCLCREGWPRVIEACYEQVVR